MRNSARITLAALCVPYACIRFQYLYIVSGAEHPLTSHVAASQLVAASSFSDPK